MSLATLPADTVRQNCADLEAMHTAYVRSTGLAVVLTSDRLRAWWALHGLGFRAADVALLAGWLKREISRAQSGQKGATRNPGALRFSNFTDPSRFEEDLLFAREACKVRTTRAPSMPALPAPGELVTVDDIREALAKMKAP